MPVSAHVCVCMSIEKEWQDGHKFSKDVAFVEKQEHGEGIEKYTFYNFQFMAGGVPQM